MWLLIQLLLLVGSVILLGLVFINFNKSEVFRKAHQLGHFGEENRTSSIDNSAQKLEFIKVHFEVLSGHRRLALWSIVISLCFFIVSISWLLFSVECFNTSEDFTKVLSVLSQGLTGGVLTACITFYSKINKNISNCILGLGS